MLAGVRKPAQKRTCHSLRGNDALVNDASVVLGATLPAAGGSEVSFPRDDFFCLAFLGGGRLFRAHVIKHARENRNVGLVLYQRTEMIGVK